MLQSRKIQNDSCNTIQVSKMHLPHTKLFQSINQKGYFVYEFMVGFNQGLLLLGLVQGQPVPEWSIDLCGLTRTVTMVQTHTAPLGLLSQLAAKKPSFILLIPFQDPKSYTELNKKTKLDRNWNNALNQSVICFLYIRQTWLNTGKLSREQFEYDCCRVTITEQCLCSLSLIRTIHFGS